MFEFNNNDLELEINVIYSAKMRAKAWGENGLGWEG